LYQISEAYLWRTRRDKNEESSLSSLKFPGERVFKVRDGFGFCEFVKVKTGVGNGRQTLAWKASKTVDFYRLPNSSGYFPVTGIRTVLITGSENVFFS
jgi:hypothetical protein